MAGAVPEGQTAKAPKSKLAEYAEMTPPLLEGQAAKASGKPLAVEEAPPREAENSDAVPIPDHDSTSVRPVLVAEDPETVARRQAFAALLDEFRRTAVLVPLGAETDLGDERGLLVADFNGIRFILAFSDEQALARYAQARGAYHREWAYQTILGAKLLDVAVPAAGVPCGVALDCADGVDGMVFPPVMGIVPDEAAVDRDENKGGVA
ncbi:hypothetical protein [Streptomyces purpurogeneiscleroticus]|uniref:hypothetical protein n=1 Tax=Streptomyces purpurogeneiscleroticus TaxID=68259 RepID=UPI001CBDB78E|nr:hypothetical protein [Streptomyces purpurogeneiscleroticus]